ncbi:alcohol dehydrogenase [Mycolicibacterium conceptionense]|uniref:alcohol dehydrogenase n=1 Tax=Mycolicibacterium conceptionense TaxID=451644 RepID=A0A0U1DS35_9MYCO|nr:alcohol dehydrogenase [Mycolicibacterium conceptionense]
MSTYRAYQVTGQRQFELVERELAPPSFGQVRVRVLSCGVCHSDVLAVEGQRPAPELPVVPGHEIVGVVDAVGDGVHTFEPGDRVGLGFLGGQCNECEFCRRGDFVNCTDQPKPGTSVDGGYAEIVYARSSGLVRVPEELAPTIAAPLLCAGVTVFNALRATAAPPGALVAVQGIGGLGHLGVQYAKRLGFRVAAISRAPTKPRIVATAASGASMSPLVAGLRPRGQLVVVGVAPDPIAVNTADLILGGRSIVGSLTGSAIDNEDNLAFSLANDISPMVEVMPFEDAPKAYERMMSGQARFRVVLDIAGATR